MPYTRWRVQLFGALQVSSNDETISRFRSKMTAAVFAYLAYHNGRPQPREVLVNQFFPDADVRSGKGRLNTAVSSVRSLFATPGSGMDAFVADYFTLALNPALFETDVAEFQNAIRRARRSTQSVDRRGFLAVAVSSYKGDLLSGRNEEWIKAERESLRDQFNWAVRELASLREEEVSPPPTTLISASQLPSLKQDVAMLPPTYTQFFGRRRELESLTELLSPSSQRTLITLTGIGGIGKTRLAHEAARQLEKTFQGRVWFVPLAELHDSERLMDVIRESLRIRKDPVADPLDQCAELLATAPSLLALDNMEQFVAEGRAAIILQSLRDRVPTLVCLVTSRHILGIAGERAFTLGPLTDADEETSIHLFEDRARAVVPSYRVTDKNYAVVKKLCLALDGIPLAIELAAARVGVLPPAQMLIQMEERFSLLRTRKRDVPDRHQSLWAAIDSSYQLLPESIKRFFSRLSVFRGGWTLSAAQAICLDEDVNNDMALSVTVEFITELQESSLLISTPVDDVGTVRFQILDTLREYATEQLAKDHGTVQTCQRHCDYFAKLAIEAEPHLVGDGVGQQIWLDKLEHDHDNLRVALSTASPLISLRMATALHRFWLIRGHCIEGRQLLRSALEVATIAAENLVVPAGYLANAQNAMGILSWPAGAYVEAREHFEYALRYYEATGERQHIARTINNIAIVSTLTGNFADARAFYEKSLLLYRMLDDSLRQSMVLTNLGAVLVYLEDYDAARTVLEECLPVQRAAQNDFLVLRTLHNLAEVAIRQDDFESATSVLAESLQLRRTLGDQYNFGDILATICALLGKQGKMEEACVVWGISQSLRASTDTVNSPADAKYDSLLFEHICQTLTEKNVEEMLKKGEAMSFTEAVFYVESQLSRSG